MDKLLRGWLDLRNYAHFAHINVRGGHFFTLHHELMKLYDEALEHADEIAERIKQLNPDEIVQMSGSTIEYSGADIRTTINDIIYLMDNLRIMQNSIYNDTAVNGDYVTNDLMVQLSKRTDFWKWQFTEFLR